MPNEQPTITPLRFVLSNPGWALGAFSVVVLSLKIVAISHGDPATISTLAGNLSATRLAIQFMTSFFTTLLMWTWLWIVSTRGLGEHSWRARLGRSSADIVIVVTLPATAIWLGSTPYLTLVFIIGIVAGGGALVRRKWKIAIALGATPQFLNVWSLASAAMLVLLSQTPLLSSEKIVTTDGTSHVVQIVTADAVNIKGIQRAGGVIDISVKQIRSRTPCNSPSHGTTLPELLQVIKMTPDC